MLTQWRLRLYEFNLDLIHRSGMENQAADAQSRSKTGGRDYIDINDHIPVAASVPTEDISGANKALSHTYVKVVTITNRIPTT